MEGKYFWKINKKAKWLISVHTCCKLLCHADTFEQPQGLQDLKDLDQWEATAAILLTQ